MNQFQYKGNELFAEDVSLKEVVAKAGSPVYVYSHATLAKGREMPMFKRGASFL